MLLQRWLPKTCCSSKRWGYFTDGKAQTLYEIGIIVAVINDSVGMYSQLFKCTVFATVYLLVSTFKHINYY